MTTSKAFEESLARLDVIVKQLDDGRTDLETALECYEEGIGLLKNCRGILEGARRKIEILRGADAEGTPQIEPVSEEAFKTETSRNKEAGT